MPFPAKNWLTLQRQVTADRGSEFSSRDTPAVSAGKIRLVIPDADTVHVAESGGTAGALTPARFIKTDVHHYFGIFIIPKKILITGSSGTIGTRLCETLLAQGYIVTGTDIRPNPWSRTIDDLTVIADLRRPGDFGKLPTDIDMVVHLAANARVYDLVLRPELARDNHEMLFNTLEFCRKHTISPFLFASSREVYGNAETAVHTEDGDGVRYCESPYAASKIGGEALVHAYHRCYGIDYIITRFSNVYGMYDTSDRVIPLFIKKTRNNQDLVVYGREKLLDFTYIDDTVAGILSCIRKFPEVKNTTFNIASGSSVTILEVAHLIRDGMSGTNAIVLGENRTGEILRSAVGISRAERELGYKPGISIEEGITRSIAWYREHDVP